MELTMLGQLPLDLARSKLHTVTTILRLRYFQAI